MWPIDILCSDLNYTARHSRNHLGSSREALYALPWPACGLLSRYSSSGMRSSSFDCNPGYHTNKNSIFNAMQIALRSTHTEISSQVLASCTCAKIGLSSEIMQRDIRRVFEMDQSMYQWLSGLAFVIWAMMVLSIWQSDPPRLVNL